jgi:hypothetical protein
MFCPKCGNRLLETPEGLICQNGKMQITKELEKRLRECYVLKTRKPSEMQFRIRIGRWFCPQCAISTIEKDGIALCPKCELCMNEFVHSLVEHHPHFDGVDRYT